MFSKDLMAAWFKILRQHSPPWTLHPFFIWNSKSRQGNFLLSWFALKVNYQVNYHHHQCQLFFEQNNTSFYLPSKADIVENNYRKSISSVWPLVKRISFSRKAVTFAKKATGINVCTILYQHSEIANENPIIYENCEQCGFF